MQTNKQIRVDFSNARTVDVRFLGLLLMLNKKLKNTRGQFPVLYQTAENLTHLRQRLRLSGVPISHWTTRTFLQWMSRWNSRRMSQGLRVFV